MNCDLVLHQSKSLGACGLYYKCLSISKIFFAYTVNFNSLWKETFLWHREIGLNLAIKAEKKFCNLV